MQPETVFALFNYGVLPFWFLLAFAPRWRWTQRLVHSALAPALLGAAYVALLLGVAIPEGAGAHSLEAAMRLFGDPWVAVLCWLHYLAFDLFVGAWIARDAVRRAIHPLAVGPCIVATLLYGPLGLVLYLALRLALRRTASLEEGVIAP